MQHEGYGREGFRRAGSWLGVCLAIAFAAALGLAAAQSAGAATWRVEQVRKSSTATWPTPSPAPTGLTYDAESKKLLVSDAEVDEGPLWQGRNLFVVARKGDLRAARQLVGATNEAEGISWYGRRKVLFVAGDARTAILRFGRGPDRKIGTGDDTVLRLLETERWGSFDPEGVTFRAQHGRVNMLIWSDAGMGSGNANAIFTVKRGPRPALRNRGRRHVDVLHVCSAFRLHGDGRGLVRPTEEQPLPRQQRAVPDLRDDAGW